MPGKLDKKRASERGRKGREASPWSRAPMVNTKRAKRKWKEHESAPGKRRG